MATLARYESFAQDVSGNVVASPTVEVRRESDNALVSLFSDRAGTVSIGNPFVAASDGLIGFHVAGGAYKILITSAGFTRTLRYVAIGTNAEVDTGGSGGSINLNTGSQITWNTTDIVISEGLHSLYSGSGGRYLNFGPNWPGSPATIPFIGIGTNNPLSQLHISASGDNSLTYGFNFGGSWGLRLTGVTENSCNFYSEAIGSGNQTLVEWLWSRARGTMSSPSQLLDRDQIGQWQIAGYQNTGGSPDQHFGLCGNFTAVAVGDYNGSSVGLRYDMFTARNGSVSPMQTLRIYGGGLIVGPHVGNDSPSILLLPNQGQLIITNNDPGSVGAELRFFHDSPSPSGNDIIGGINFDGRDDSGAIQQYGLMQCVIVGTSVGLEQSVLNFAAYELGAGLTMQLGFGALWPTSNINFGLQSNKWQGLYFTGPLSSGAPATKTGTSYSLVTADVTLIFNASGTFTLTLQAAGSHTGRMLFLKNIAAQAVNSASSNVVPQAGGSAGTAILAATAGKWALLQSDGTNWQILFSN